MLKRRITFWEAFGSDAISQIERQAINAAADSIDALDMKDRAMERQLRELGEQVAAQESYIRELHAVLHVVVTALGEGGASAAVLNARIEAALDALRPPPVVPAEPVAPPPPREVACHRCGAIFLENRLNIIAEGLVCDPCFHK